MKTIEFLSVGSALLAGIALVTTLARRSKACTLITPTTDYIYLKYTGPDKTYIDALGACGPVIYTIESWDGLQWYTPVLPTEEILFSGTECRIIVLQPCKLCNFEPSAGMPELQGFIDAYILRGGIG